LRLDSLAFNLEKFIYKLDSKSSMSQETSMEEFFEDLPQVTAGKGVWQNSFHDFDVYDHTLQAVMYIKRLTDDKNLIAAAYLHDIGKPVVAVPQARRGPTAGKKSGKASGLQYNDFPDHEVVGENMVRRMDRSLFLRFGLDKELVASLVGCHYFPMDGIKLMRRADSFKEFMKIYKDLENALSNATASMGQIMILFVADKLAQGKSGTDRDELFMIMELLLKKKKNFRQVYELQQDKYKRNS
jgi:hypothetical protein